MEGILDSASTSAAWLRYTGQAVYNAAFQADLQNRLCVSVRALFYQRKASSKVAGSARCFEMVSTCARSDFTLPFTRAELCPGARCFTLPSQSPLLAASCRNPLEEGAARGLLVAQEESMPSG